MKFYSFLIILFITIPLLGFAEEPLPKQVLPVGLPEPAFMEAFPHLKNYTYKEPSSGFYFGIGGSPVGIVGDRMIFSINFFQLHYLYKAWDFELFNASYGFTRTGDADLESDHFVFRMAAKYKLNSLISLGPMVGYELVSFQNIEAKLYKAPYVTPEWEPFSSRGFIYGVMASQTFPYKSKYQFRINEVIFKQTYSVTDAEHGWSYLYKNSTVQADRSQIEGGYVAAVEFSILY